MPSTPPDPRPLPLGGYRPATMCPQSAKDEVRFFEKVLLERTPAVKQASRSLQAVMGVPPGTRMIGQEAVTMWEMPAPPAPDAGNDELSFADLLGGELVDPEVFPQTFPATEFFGNAYEAEHTIDPSILIRRHGPVLDLPQIVIDPPSADPAPANPPTLSLAAALQKRKRAPSPPPKPQFRTARKRVKIDVEVIDLTHSPDVQLSSYRVPPEAPVQPVLAPALRQYESASPPPWNDTAVLPTVNASWPIYWAPALTSNICSWLETPGTVSAQCQLLHLELRAALHYPNQPPQASKGLMFEADNYEKLKLIRLRTSESITASHRSTTENASQDLRNQAHDWLIIVCVSMGAPDVSGDGFNWDTLDPDELMEEDELPYWIIAFPVNQVTHADVRPYTAMPKEASTPRGPTRVADMMYTTTLSLGLPGRVPLLHGRDVNERFADGFIKAYAEDMGVVEMRSQGLLPLQRL